MSRRSLLLAACGAAALAASLTIPALVLDASQYVALASGVQAFGVVAALVFGAATLAREAKDKRLDRVAAIFDGYQTGHSDARYRLLGLLEGPDGISKPASLRQIRQDPDFSRYPGTPGTNPRIDAERILLFFESLNGLRSAGALDLPLTLFSVGIFCGGTLQSHMSRSLKCVSRSEIWRSGSERTTGHIAPHTWANGRQASWAFAGLSEVR
jgi:hypothetical protein